MAVQMRAPGAVLLGSDFKALGMARSLGRRGVPCVVVDTVPRAAWFSRYVVDRLRWRGAMDGPDFVDFLLRAGKQRGLEGWVLFPTADEIVEVVARHRRELMAFYRPGAQDWDIVRWANDKRLTYRLAEQTGVPYPRTWYPADGAHLGSLDIMFPAIVKPATSVRLQYAMHLKALPAARLDELCRQYEVAARVLPPSEIMVQEVVAGNGGTQFSVGAFCVEGQMLQSMTAKRTRQYPFDYGLGSTFVEATPVPTILDFAQTLLGGMGATGMVEVEFKHDRRDGRYKLLDINLRPWGWHTLCMACGLDFPYLHYCYLLGYPVPQTTPRYGHRWMRAITDLPAGLQEIRAGITTPSAYIRSLAGPIEFSVLDWRDPLPVLGDFASALYRSRRGFGRPDAMTPLPTEPPTPTTVA
jgi:predicted ATP-grasp superfamily ATP-dependent carboligase